MKLKIVLIIISIIAIVLAIGTEIRMANFKKDVQQQLNRISNVQNEKITANSKEIDNLQTYFQPNGIVEKFIVSNAFIKKNMNDLDKILNDFQDDNKTGYLQIYIEGSKEVWCAFKDENDKYSFQGNLSPGLNDYKFYFFKEPAIETKYSYNIDVNSFFISGDMQKVYFLIHEPGQSRLRKHPAEKITNITKDLNLYIPGLTGK